MAQFYLLLGIVIGMILARFILCRTDHQGTIVIDRSDPDGPIIFLESQEPLNSLLARKYVLYKVEVRDYISQK